MPEHEGVGPHLHLLEKEPDDALAIGQREGLGCLVQLGEEAFKALGQRHVGLGVRQLSLKGGQLSFGGGFLLAQRRHPPAQFFQGEEFLLIRLDEPGGAPRIRPNALVRLSRFTVMGCSVRSVESRRSIS
jgi:hypothetical protein